MEHAVMGASEQKVRLQRLERLLAGLPAEAGVLWEDFQALRKHLAQQDRTAEELERAQAVLQQEARRLGEALSQMQRRNAEMGRQLVAVERLHSSLDRGHLLLALEEIVATLVGSEELALLEAAGSSLLVPVHSVGVSPGAIAAVRFKEGTLGQALAAGAPWIADDRGAGGRFEPRLTACVPLKVEGQVTGALAIFRLLEHKSQLEDSDLELLDLIGLHLGTALLCARRPAGMER